eukprot:scaffold135884_cov229-Phaeocystis_antarctica.AAC.1
MSRSAKAMASLRLDVTARLSCSLMPAFAHGAGLVCRLSARRDAVCSLRCPVCRQEGENAHSADGAAHSAD